MLFYSEPSTINIRKAKYTIGKSLDDFWNEKKHSGRGEKYFDEEFQTWYCRDCFDKFIEINQNLKYKEEISHICFMKGKRFTTLKFYKTKKENPIFVNEEGIYKIGECKLDIEKEYESYKDREIKTIMKFGGTFIDVAAIHLKSGISVKTTLTFD